MFCFMYGDIPILLRYEEKIEEIKRLNPEIPMKIFDASQGEGEFFLEAISVNSMFSSKELIVLKRAEKIKKLDNLLKIIGEYDLSKKEVIVVYEEELNDFGKAVNEVGKKVLDLAKKNGEVIEARKATEKKALQNYIKKELDISDYNAEILFEMLGDDFFKVKNEVEKIKIFLDDKPFILEEIIPILSVSEEYNLKKLTEEFLNEDNVEKLLNHLKKTKEYMLFLYLLSDELILALKLVSLKKIGEINSHLSYNNFKDGIYENIKKYFKNNRGYMREYPIFLKFKYMDIFEEEFLLKKLEEVLEIEYKIKNGEIEEEIGVEKIIVGFKE